MAIKEKDKNMTTTTTINRAVIKAAVVHNSNKNMMTTNLLVNNRIDDNNKKENNTPTAETTKVPVMVIPQSWERLIYKGNHNPKHLLLMEVGKGIFLGPQKWQNNMLEILAMQGYFLKLFNTCNRNLNGKKLMSKMLLILINRFIVRAGLEGLALVQLVLQLQCRLLNYSLAVEVKVVPLFIFFPADDRGWWTEQ